MNWVVVGVGKEKKEGNNGERGGGIRVEGMKEGRREKRGKGQWKEKKKSVYISPE